MGDLLDLAVTALEALIRWLRIARHDLCCERPTRWATTFTGRLVVSRCDECRIERVLVEKGWNRHGCR